MHMSYRRYLVHSFLQNFAQSLFYAFGTLLLYNKTHSILVVLGYLFISKLSSVLAKAFLTKSLFRTIRSVGVVPVMGIGLLLMAAVFVGIFYLPLTSQISYLFLFLLALLNSLGILSYWVPSNAFLYGAVGNSAVPGRYSSFADIVATLAGIAAAGAGLFLN